MPSLLLQAQLAPSLLPPGAPGALASPHGPDGTLHLPQYNLVVMSYEALRADVDWVVTIPWLYCVLDEGHVIKSPKARITIAVKRVPAAHRWVKGTRVQVFQVSCSSSALRQDHGFLAIHKLSPAVNPVHGLQRRTQHAALPQLRQLPC